MFVFSTISLEVSLAASKKLTVDFRVFDWDMFKDSDKIGEVINHNLSKRMNNLALPGTSSIV